MFRPTLEEHSTLRKDHDGLCFHLRGNLVGITNTGGTVVLAGSFFTSARGKLRTLYSSHFIILLCVVQTLLNSLFDCAPSYLRHENAFVLHADQSEILSVWEQLTNAIFSSRKYVRGFLHSPSVSKDAL
jgi:hypothetical protein